MRPEDSTSGSPFTAFFMAEIHRVCKSWVCALMKRSVCSFLCALLDALPCRSMHKIVRQRNLKRKKRSCEPTNMTHLQDKHVWVIGVAVRGITFRGGSELVVSFGIDLSRLKVVR